MMRALYIALALLIIGGYGYASYNGLEMSSTKSGFAPQGVRGRHGGTTSVWYYGYRGGK